MRLAEAIMERDVLKKRLETLESRLRDDNSLPRHRGQLAEEMRSTALQMRDLNIAIDWTELRNSLHQLPLKAHRHKIETSSYLAEVFEKINPDEADELWRSAADDHKVIEAATWLIDLQVPTVEGKTDER